ncbi:MAG: MmcQ/YjbR family DNA-binding protein [Clostridia bacterium]
MYDWLNTYLLQHPAVTQAYKSAWKMEVFLIGGKIFAEIGEDKHGSPILTVKLEPAFSELLRAQYPAWIVPGYYSNKVHWSSLSLQGNVPDDTVRTMVDNAYSIVRAALPRKVQTELPPIDT